MTPEVTKRIWDAISGGNFRDVAARWAGVPLRTFRRWCAEGKNATKGAKHEFWHALLEAEKTAEIRAVALVMRAAQEDAKHAEWWLERKFPKRWGRKDSRKITITEDRIKAETERVLKLVEEASHDAEDEATPAA